RGRPRCPSAGRGCRCAPAPSAPAPARTRRPAPTTRRPRPPTSAKCDVRWPWFPPCGRRRARVRADRFCCLPRMIYQTHVTDKARRHAALLPSTQKCVDLLAAELPVIVEIGDDRFHERLRQPDGAIRVAEIVVEDRQCQLLRAFALIGPFEPEAGEALDVVM